MKTIVPTSIIVLGITVISLVSACLIGFQMQITSARNYHANVINKIQNSYYNEQVMKECITDANSKNYHLTFEDLTVYDYRRNVKVKMDYTVKIPLINVSKTETIEGIAK